MKKNINVAKAAESIISREKVKDEVWGYCQLLFRHALPHKNLDSAVGMGERHRSVWSAKYELPLFVKTNTVKNVIGLIHLVSLTEGVLDERLQERLVENRSVNLHGSKKQRYAPRWICWTI